MKKTGCLLLLLLTAIFTMANANDSTLHWLEQADYYQKNNKDSALLLTKKVLNKTSNDTIKARAYYIMGNTLLRHYEYEESLTAYHKSIPFITSKNTYFLAKVYNNIGLAYKNTAKYDSAIAYYFKSLYLQKEEKSAKPLYNIGIIYRIMGNYEEAIIYHNKSLTLCKAYKDSSGIANIINGLGIIYSNKGDYQKALSYFYQYLQLLHPTNLKKIKVANGNIGTTYESLNKLDSAYLFTNKALKMSREINDELGILINLNNSANILTKQGRYTSALCFYKEADQIAKHLGNTKEQMQIYLSISDTYQAMHHDKESLEYIKRYHTLKDSILNHNTKVALAEEKTKYTQLVLEKKLLVLESEKEAQARKEQFILYIISAIILFIIIIGSFAYLYYKERNEKIKNKTQKKIAFEMLNAEEVEKEKISDQLYNNLGSLMTVMKYTLLPFKKVSEEGYNEAVNLVNEASKTSRSISYRLFSMELKTFGLGDAVKTLFIYLNKLHDTKEFMLKTNLSQENRVSWESELHLFRITQELVKNTLTHAEASEIYLSIQYENGTIKYNYKDNGKGFKTSKIKKGMGLKSIENRANSIDMKVKINSNNKGTNIIIQ